MRLALHHGTLLEPENWSIFKKIRPSALIPALPVSWPVSIPAKTAAPKAPARKRRVPTLDTLFIRWMRMALIAALVALWSLAGWVVVDALRMIFA